MGALESLEPTLIAVAARCLRVNPAGINPQAPLARYGLDSLSALELGTAIGDAVGIEVGEDWLFDSPSIRELAQRVLERSAPRDECAARLARIAADVVLAADIDPARVPPASGTTVLLTGANGFLGAHLIAELLATDVDAILCPVRAASDAEAQARVRATLARYALGPALPHPRVRVFAADIGRPLFGLEPARHAELASAVAAVLHCAADLNWAASYEALRAINVGATEALLRFACTTMRKRMHFVSSAAACYSTRGSGTVQEDDTVAALEGIHLGYAQSKWAAERLVDCAHARGLATVIYRPALIGGHGVRGTGNDDDLVARLVGGCVALGHAPDLDWQLDLCPVDFVARAIARLAREPQRAQRIVHLRNPRPAHWNEAVLWLDLHGSSVAMEPFASWIERVRRDTREPAHPLHRLRPFLLDQPEGEGGRYLPQLYARPHVPTLAAQRSEAWLERLGVQCPRLGSQLLERYVASWTRGGILPRRSGARVDPIAPTEKQWNAALQAALRAHFAEPGLAVQDSAPHDSGSEHSLLGELASWRSASRLALHARTVRVIRAGGRASTLELVLKPKPGAERLLVLTAEVAARCERELGAAFAAYGAASELAASGQRELALYASAGGRLRAGMPVWFGTIEVQGVAVLVLERVRAAVLIDGLDTALWSPERIRAALAGGARIHAQWLGREQELADLHVRADGAEADPAAAGRWLAALSVHAAPWLRQWLGDGAARSHAQLARDWRARLQAARALPRTLVHHDFNPRNIALRSTPLGPRLCAFDWELAAYGLPQRDLVELLCFVLTPAAAGEAPRYLEYARLALERASRRAFDTAAWHRGVRIALADFGVRRLPMYFIAHRFRPQGFLERVARTWWQLANALGTAP